MSKYGRPPHEGMFDLTEIGSTLRASEAYERQGQSAHTLLREDDLRVVVVTMKAGARMAEHQANTTAMVQALSGHIRVGLPDETTDLHAGQLLVFKRGLSHDVEAVVDSKFLLTLGWSSGGE